MYVHSIKRANGNVFTELGNFAASTTLNTQTMIDRKDHKAPWRSAGHVFRTISSRFIVTFPRLGTKLSIFFTREIISLAR